MRAYYGDDLESDGVDRNTCDHSWHPWRSAPGSNATGAYCPRCGELQVD